MSKKWGVLTIAGVVGAILLFASAYLGYQLGEEAGFQEGKQAGYRQGHEAGYKVGLNDGVVEAKEIGYLERKISYLEGEEAGYRRGLDDGFREGKRSPQAELKVWRGMTPRDLDALSPEMQVQAWKEMTPADRGAMTQQIGTAKMLEWYARMGKMEYDKCIGEVRKSAGIFRGPEDEILAEVKCK